MSTLFWLSSKSCKALSKWEHRSAPVAHLSDNGAELWCSMENLSLEGMVEVDTRVRGGASDKRLGRKHKIELWNKLTKQYLEKKKGMKYITDNIQ